MLTFTGTHNILKSDRDHGLVRWKSNMLHCNLVKEQNYGWGQDVRVLRLESRSQEWLAQGLC